ncbi:glycosyltransferase [Chelativorans sp. AA-79]|uniref:glycosyltransferase n=1 Tax=Chelativorans sp. AA-79 TaxID=3028735 RepID=UPI0023F7FA25|nr:glycosyltransferase [Chelativorans sp. AA-79]WEX10718.1 glycosyltransferase [Chelativorans sp. AA-79]
MNVVMFTNTFTPHIGGVAHSVAWLAEGLRSAGHRVLVVAPEYADLHHAETDVVRIPAIKHFRGSDFSLPLPLTRTLDERLDTFRPDIVHSHHPFLLGDVALRTAASRCIPIVYTYHTRYELYDHYVSEGVPILERLVLSIALGYCDLCHAVIAPSRSMADFLIEHGVKTPVTVIPTGIEPALFAAGDGNKVRVALGLPPAAFVVGHVGRLAPEKNLPYLAEAVGHFLMANPRAHFVVVGEGPSRPGMEEALAKQGLSERVHTLGALESRKLADIYAAMDVFAFSSLSETQGLVLAEAMAAGVPVVALDAFGAREIVRDGQNGYLLSAAASTECFARALAKLAELQPGHRCQLSTAARRTAGSFSRGEMIDATLKLYFELLESAPKRLTVVDSNWSLAKRRLAQEWKIVGNFAHALGDALFPPDRPVAVEGERLNPGRR